MNSAQAQLDADINRFYWRNGLIAIFIIGAVLCAYRAQITNMLLCFVTVALIQVSYVLTNLHVMASEYVNGPLNASNDGPLGWTGDVADALAEENKRNAQQ